MNRGKAILLSLGLFVMLSTGAAWWLDRHAPASLPQGAAPAPSTMVTSAHHHATRNATATHPPAEVPDPATPLDQYIAMGPDTAIDVALLEAALTGSTPTATELERLAAQRSYAYRSEPDAFKKQQRLKILLDGLRLRLQSFQNHRYIALPQPFTLEPYEVDTHSFRVTPVPGATIDWLYHGRLRFSLGTTVYEVHIMNAEAYSTLTVTDTTRAQTLEALTVPDRSGQGRAYLFIRSIDPTTHTLQASMISAQLFDAQHRLMGIVQP